MQHGFRNKAKSSQKTYGTEALIPVKQRYLAKVNSLEAVKEQVQVATGIK